MTTKQQVFQLLTAHTGHPISEEALARQLGKSRATILKAIRSLKQDGFQITMIHNQGYELHLETDQIAACTIQQLLGVSPWHIEVWQTTPSTNLLAKEYAHTPTTTPALFISEEQTAGRGRLGRTFVSPAKTGLYMSLCVFPNQSLEELTLVTCLTATALAQTIETYLDESIGIKWVNDLFYQQKKIAGILTEIVTPANPQQAHALIVGIGVNLFPHPNAFTGTLHNKVGSVFSSQEQAQQVHFNRNHFIARLITRWNHLYQQLPQKQFMSEYQKRSIVIGKQIRVLQGENEYPATAIGIDDQGQLIIQTADQQKQHLRYGDISIRPQNVTFESS